MVKPYQVIVRNGIWYRVPRHLVEPNVPNHTAIMARIPLITTLEIPDLGNRLKLPWYVHH
jgi:hypothetical protein